MKEIYTNAVHYGTPTEEQREDSNKVIYSTSRNSTELGHRQPVKYNDTLVLFEALGQTEQNASSKGSRAGYFIFQASDDFEPGKHGGEFFLATTNIGTDIEQMRMIVDSDRIYLQSDKIIMGNNTGSIHATLTTEGDFEVAGTLKSSNGYFGKLTIMENTIANHVIDQDINIELQGSGKLRYNGKEVATVDDVVALITELVLNKK